MYSLKRSKKFKRGFKKVSRRNDFEGSLFLLVVDKIQKGLPLAVKYKNHKLRGEFVGCMECHIQSDILLIYMVDIQKNIVYLLRIGSHADLF